MTYQEKEKRRSKGSVMVGKETFVIKKLIMVSLCITTVRRMSTGLDYGRFERMAQRVTQ